MHQQTVYSRLARIYDFFLFSILGYKQKAHYFLSQIPLDVNKPISILDAGCGTGLFTFAAVERYPNVSITAFDLNEKMIEIFNEKLQRSRRPFRLRLFQHNILEKLNTTETFDLIVASGVLEYTPAQQVVKNLVRHLKPGGYFLNCAVHNSRMGRLTGLLYRFRPYTLEENKRMLEHAGLTDVRAIELPRSYFPLRTVRIGIIGRKPMERITIDSR